MRIDFKILKSYKDLGLKMQWNQRNIKKTKISTKSMLDWLDSKVSFINNNKYFFF